MDQRNGAEEREREREREAVLTEESGTVRRGSEREVNKTSRSKDDTHARTQ